MYRTLLVIAAAVLSVVGCSKEPASTPAAVKTAATEVRVAAAASLKPVLPTLLDAYAKSHSGVTITPTYGASGTFHSQLLNGAPFDLFLSADMKYPQELEKAGLTDGSTREYATGRLMIWAARVSGLDVSTLDVLKDARVTHIAIANPRTAPYGRAAEAALKAANLYDVVQPKLVLGESVEQAATFVRTGAAEVALLPRSQTLVAPMTEEGIAAEVPSNLYEPIRHGAVVMKTAKDAAAARALLDFLTGPEGQRILAKSGLGKGP